jgi:iron(III) transport system substrate-binding protein
MPLWRLLTKIFIRNSLRQINIIDIRQRTEPRQHIRKLLREIRSIIIPRQRAGQLPNLLGEMQPRPRRPASAVVLLILVCNVLLKLANRQLCGHAFIISDMRHLLIIPLLLLSACERTPSGTSATQSTSTEVVIYSSIDDPYLRPLMQRFEKESNLTVRIVTDTEATKSASLVERLIAEKSRPQCDVYWGNEIFHTINLAQQGLFAVYRPKSADDIPAKWRDKDDLYTCVGLRARMLAIHHSLMTPLHQDVVASLEMLNADFLRGKIAMAHPAFGTTSGHMAALYVAWGEEKFTAWMKKLRANDIKLLGGNSEVARQVAAGTVVAGLTDNDDINNMKAEGGNLEGILPDQRDNAIGTLLIPGTVALVNNAPHADSAKKLIDFICDASVEKELIAGRYLAYSVRDTSKVKAMNVDYAQAAREMKKAIELALTILQERKP